MEGEDDWLVVRIDVAASSFQHELKVPHGEVDGGQFTVVGAVAKLGFVEFL